MGIGTAAGFCLVRGLEAEEQLLLRPPAEPLVKGPNVLRDPTPIVVNVSL
jgi:hypothetical protein